MSCATPAAPHILQPAYEAAVQPLLLSCRTPYLLYLVFSAVTVVVMFLVYRTGYRKMKCALGPVPTIPPHTLHQTLYPLPPPKHSLS